MSFAGFFPCPWDILCLRVFISPLDPTSVISRHDDICKGLRETAPDGVSGRAHQWLLAGRQWRGLVGPLSSPFSHHAELATLRAGAWGPLCLSFSFCLSLQPSSGKRSGLFRRARHERGVGLWMKICFCEWAVKPAGLDSPLSRELGSALKSQWRTFSPLQDIIQSVEGEMI